MPSDSKAASAVTNPNNPVGTILTEAEMDAIVAVAKSAGAWLLADEVTRSFKQQLTYCAAVHCQHVGCDPKTPCMSRSPRLCAVLPVEIQYQGRLCWTSTDGGAFFKVYRGTERLTDEITPSFWGRYDKVVCVGSLSKAFGLPGLRLGWLVASPSIIEEVCSLS